MSTVHGGPGNIVKDGLVLYLDAANPRSYPPPYTGTTWTDLAGTNNGTLINGPMFNSANGGSIVFDGVNDRTSFGNINLSSTDKISLDFWCKILTYPMTDGTTNILIELSNNFNSSTVGFFIGIGDDSTPSPGMNKTFPISLNIRGDVGYNVHGYDKSNVDDLQWHHWVCVFDKSISGSNPIESKLYIDGIEKQVSVLPQSTLRVDNTNNFGNVPLYIGSRSSGIAPSNAEVSGIKIYNRALSASEILRNYNATRARFGI